MSLTAICSTEGVSYAGVKNRILRGATLEEAMEASRGGSREMNHYTIEYEGESWSVPELAMYLGINKNKLYEAVKKAKETGKELEITFRSRNYESE